MLILASFPSHYCPGARSPLFACLNHSNLLTPHEVLPRPDVDYGSSLKPFRVMHLVIEWLQSQPRAEKSRNGRVGFLSFKCWLEGTNSVEIEEDYYKITSFSLEGTRTDPVFLANCLGNMCISSVDAVCGAGCFFHWSNRKQPPASACLYRFFN